MNKPDPSKYSAPPDEYDREVEKSWADHEADKADDEVSNEKES